MTDFQRHYDQIVGMARYAYGRLGWEHEQAPMMFGMKRDGKVEIYVIPVMEGPVHKEAVAQMHRDLARREDMEVIVLVIESWLLETDRSEMRKYERTGLRDAPGRREALMINIRSGSDQRIGYAILDREGRTLTALPLEDIGLSFGRFVGDVRNESRH